MKKWLIAIEILLLLSMPASIFGTVKPLACSWDFLSPSGLFLEEDGTLLVVDRGLHNLISLKDNKSKLIAGYTLPPGRDSHPAGGYLDSTAELALFNSPFAVVRWNGGYVVSDYGNNSLRFIQNGTVRTLLVGETPAMLNGPLGLTVDDKGLLYIADSGNGRILTVDSQGNVATYATGFLEPAGLCWSEGILYVSDAGTHQILRVKDKTTTVIAGRYESDGSANMGGFLDGKPSQAEFSYPLDLLVKDGTIYVADTGNSAIRRIQNGWVSTLACYRDSATGLWPGSPTGLALKDNTLYTADTFAGLILETDTDFQLFDDIPVSEWYANPVSYLYTSKIISGTSGTHFSPGEVTTRGQLVSMLHRIAGLPAPHSKPSFTDVSEAQYYGQAIAWAAEQGIVTGTGGGAFSPDQEITREELMTILYHYAAKTGDKDLSGTTLSAYTDRESISSYALASMAWGDARNLISGMGDGRIAPGGTATRGQTATILTNFLTMD